MRFKQNIQNVLSTQTYITSSRIVGKLSFWDLAALLEVNGKKPNVKNKAPNTKVIRKNGKM